MVTESHHFLPLNFRFLLCEYVCACLFILFMSLFLILLEYYLSLLNFIIYFILLLFLHIFLKKMRIQSTENSEKDNSGTKQEVRKKRTKHR